MNSVRLSRRFCGALRCLLLLCLPLGVAVTVAATAVTPAFAQVGRPAVATGHGKGNWVRRSAGGEVFLKIEQGTPMMVFEKVRACYRIVLNDGTEGWMAERTIGFTGATGPVVVGPGPTSTVPVVVNGVVEGSGTPIVERTRVVSHAHRVVRAAAVHRHVRVVRRVGSARVVSITHVRKR